MKIPFIKSSQPQKPAKQSGVFKYDDNDSEWVETLDARIEASKSFWEEKYKLSKVTEENEKLYLGTNVLDNNEEEELSLDNRIFSSIRTVVPYATTRITEPVVYPSSNSEAAKQFAQDLEKALFAHADDENLKPKVKFALEDAIIRRRGYLKPRYDAVNRNFCAVEYVPADSIIVDHKAKAYEEPRYFRHILDKTVGDLLTQFPEMAEEIKHEFHIDQNTPKSAYDEECKINEDWCFVPSEEEGLDLIVTWAYKGICLGKMQDPNWRYGKSNFLPHHMMPLVPVNVLNDGRTHIDKTSFVEQAKLLQENVDRRSTQISKNAGLGSTGMPVVDSAALADDQSEYLSFDSDVVLELDVGNANGKSINDVFTTWQAAPLQAFVYQDKIDSRNAIDNAFGTPNVFRGEQTDSNTLGQDVLIRDQAAGRQQEVLDAIDFAMTRLYKLMAQFLLVYGSEKELFRFVGENGEFDYVLMNTEEFDPDVVVRVKSGTSMPVDRAQRRQTADSAAARGFIDPLSYWEIMDEPNAQKYAKRLMDYTNDPATFMQDASDEVFNRDAFIDIELIKNGAQPPFREDLPKEYFDYLNKYVLSGNLESPTISPEVKMLITQFIDAQLARGQRMLGMMTTQLPTPEDVQLASQQIDEANAAQGGAPPAEESAPEQV